MAECAADPTGIEIWLAGPDAARQFDLETLDPADRQRYHAIRTPRRMEEFKVSRALQARSPTFRSVVRSLTHSGGHAALVIAPAGLAVGIDIEVRRPRDVLRLARNVYSASEIQAIENTQEVEREHLFYALWTLKEALAKALRLNLMDALRQCTFTVSDGIWSGSAPTPSRWSAAVFTPADDMYLALAVLRAPSLNFPPPVSGGGPGRGRSETWQSSSSPHPVLPPRGGGRDAYFRAGDDREVPLLMDDSLAPLRMWEWPPPHAAHWPVIARASSLPRPASSSSGAAAPPAAAP